MLDWGLVYNKFQKFVFIVLNQKQFKKIVSHFKLLAEKKKKKAKCDVLGSSLSNRDQRCRHYSVDYYNNLYER